MIIAVDTGGTNTLITSFDAHGKIGEQVKFPTPTNKKEYAKQLRSELERLYAGKPVRMIAIALPGIIQGGVAVWCNNLKWKNFDVAAELKGVLAGAPIVIENDANLAGLAEARAIQPIPISSLYVTISTGIGSGFVSNGQIDPALRLSEAGHMLVEYDGVVREWESFASGRAIKDTYNKFARDITSKRAWYNISDRMSRGFLAIIPLMQPDYIVIGGSIGTYFDRYQQTLLAMLRERLPDHIPVPKIVQAKHPEEAVVYGCYYYARDILAHTKTI